MQSRYYNPEWGRFINADAIAGGIGAVLTQNAYAYCQNQPINHKDPSGYIWETALDIGSIGWSAYNLVTRPSWRNAAYLAWDVGASAIPFVPGSYVARAGKVAKTVAKRSGNFGKLYKGLGTVVNSSPVKKITRIYRGNKAEPFHYIQRKTIRGVSSKAIISTFKKPKVILSQWKGERFLYVSDKAAIVVNKAGEIVTVWGRNDFGEKLLQVLKEVRDNVQ